MLITDQFVFLHMPKTGGTFVRHVLFRLHAARAYPLKRFLGQTGRRRKLTQYVWLCAAVVIAKLRFRDKYGRLEYQRPKHGGWGKIPEPHRNKPVLATVRNPHDWYVSQYEFGWWSKVNIPNFSRLTRRRLVFASPQSTHRLVRGCQHFATGC